MNSIVFQKARQFFGMPAWGIDFFAMRQIMKKGGKRCPLF